jgi:MGT family glycosyltransferase
MGKAVFFNLPGATGHINPTLGVVAELIKRGEQVIYYAGEESFDQLKALGATPRSYQAYFDYKHSAEYGTDIVVMALTQLTLTEKSIHGLIAELKQDRPDYIIYDSCCLWGKYIARHLGIPAICSITTLVSHPLAVFSDWQLGSLVIKTLVTGVPIVVSGRRRIINILNSINLEYQGLFHHIFDLFQNEGDINLVFLSSKFQPFSSQLKSNFKFVGASVPEGRDHDDLHLADRLDGRPLIYISLGTVHNLKTDFYKNCYEAFKNTPYFVVMSVGKNTDISQLGPMPDNFLVRNRVPQLEVLKKANLFISHGGMNSINESLYFNVPLIMVPQQPEQHFNARRIQKFGAGVRLPAEKITPQTLRESAQQILGNPDFLVNAKDLGRTLREPGGHVAAADAILGLARSYPQAVRKTA